MDKCKITIGNKSYQVSLAKTEEEQITGLQGVHTLPEYEGVLFVFEEPGEVGFWMKDTEIPLDIIFINEDFEVISIAKGQPESKDIHEEKDVKYVLELNIDSGVTVGDELEFLEDDKPISKMLVLDENGETQLELDGGERIFSRPHTKTLLKMASRAYKSKKDSDYKALGNKVFSYIKAQDERGNEYVELNKE